MRVVFMFAVLLAGLFPLAANADDAGSLLAKHKAFAGWDSSDTSMASWHLRGTRTHGGARDTFEEYRSGIAFRDRIATPSGISDQTGFTGRYVWHADENGFWSPVLGRQAQAAIAWQLVRTEMLGGYAPQVVGQATVDGKPCTILQVEPQGLVATDIYEDAQSGAFLRVVVAPGAVGSTTYDDITYTATPSGKKIVGGWTVDNSRYAVSDATVGSVATSELVAPPPQASWTYSDTPTPLTMAALSLNDRLVEVEATVNGRRGTFILGTDTPSIILFSPFAAAAGVKGMGSSDFSPYLGNPQFAGYAQAQTLQVGDAVLHNVTVQEMTDANEKLAGYLGYDFFAQAVVDLDLAKHTLKIEDPRTFAPQPPAGSFTFPLDLTQGVPAVSITLPSGAVAHPVFSSNLSGFMLLSQALYDSGKIGGHQITNDSSTYFGNSVGALGDPITSGRATITYTAWNGASTSGICMTTPQINVGPYRYQNPPVCLGGINVFGDDGGLVGVDFLRHFNWIVDYPRQQFTLSPNGQ